MLNYSNLNILLDAADSTSTESATGSLISTLVMMVLMIVVFYFFLIRPQKKKDKQVKDMLAALKVGDRVCTIGGIYGTVTAIKGEDQIVIAVGVDKTKMNMARWAIKSVENAPLENDATPEV